MTECLGRPDEGQAALLLVAQDLDTEAALALDPRDDLGAVRSLANRRGGDDPNCLRAQLLGEADLRRDDVRDLDDLVLVDRAVVRGPLADLVVGALLHDLAELPALGLGDEDARGIRADVDRRAEHLGDLLRTDGWASEALLGG